jgi:predicted ATPase
MQPAIRSLTVQNLLSFGDVPTTIELRSLNLLIGPNGSGKSNLIEVLGLLQNAPGELAAAISNGGGIDEWLWKGAPKTPVASVQISTVPTEEVGRYQPMPLMYRLAFTKAGFRFQIADERVEDERPLRDAQGQPTDSRPNSYFAFENGRPMLDYSGTKRQLRQEEINPQLSILAQRKDPDH